MFEPAYKRDPSMVEQTKPRAVEPPPQPAPELAPADDSEIGEFDMLDTIDAELVEDDAAAGAESAGESVDEEGRPRRRRRRRRGGRRNRRDRPPADQPASEESLGDTADDEEPTDLDLEVDEPERAEQAEEGEPRERKGRRRRRRRGSGRGRERAAEGPAASGDKSRVDGESADVDDVDDYDDEFGDDFGDDDLGDEVATVTAGADDAEGESESSGGQGEKNSHRAIPSWEEALGTMIATNMEGRSKNPRGGAPRGRGRGGSRGGQGRRSSS
jgi:hypothetical protein